MTGSTNKGLWVQRHNWAVRVLTVVYGMVIMVEGNGRSELVQKNYKNLVKKAINVTNWVAQNLYCTS